MKRYSSILAALTVSLLWAHAGFSQSALETMKAAAQFRQELVISVIKDGEPVEQALQRLSQQRVASGFATFSASEDQAQAAWDIAKDLLGWERPDLAEFFLVAAEQSYVQAVRENRGLGTKRKAQLLKTLATIRGGYLSKRQEAKNDIEEAARLDPSDKTIADMAAKLKASAEGVRSLNRRN